MIPDDAPTALAAAASEADPSSLAAATRMRRRFGPDAAAWALSQVALRRRGRAKFGRADEMLFTPDGVEQATRDAVRRWRADSYLKGSGGEARTVWDLGCGIGADAMAFAEAGLEVRAVDADPLTAAVATWNLGLVGAGPAHVGRAEDAVVAQDAAVFLDPARRGARGRTWNVADFTPSWDLVLAYLASPRFVCVKLGPGLPKELIPEGVRACWVSERGDVVEVSLWNRLEAGVSAVLLGGEGRSVSLERRAGDPVPKLDVKPLGRWLYEPDGAVIRAGLIAEAMAGHDAWLLDERVAYLSSDDPVDTPFTTRFEVVDVLDYNVKTLRAYVREHGLGTLEIKKRAVDVDPAQLRRDLKPRGGASATIVLARTVEGTKAVVVRR